MVSSRATSVTRPGSYDNSFFSRKCISNSEEHVQYKEASYSGFPPPRRLKTSVGLMVHILASLALALAGSPAALVSAAPARRGGTITIPVSKGTSGNPITASDVVDHDLNRVSAYNGKPPARNGNGINEDVSYVARVSVCSQTFNLIVDTGSSNLWVRTVSLGLSSDFR